MKSYGILHSARLLTEARFFTTIFIFLMFSGLAVAESRIPKSDEEVLEKIPTQLLRRERAERALTAPAKKEKLLPETLNIIRSEIEAGRKSGDPRFYGHAAALIEPWLKEGITSADILLFHATVLQYNHDFSAALLVLNKVLEKIPHSAQAWLMRSAIEATTGDLISSQKSCRHLFQLAGERITAACLTAAASDRTSLENAQTLLQRVLEDTPTKEDGVEGSWAEGILAESQERLGRLAEAETAYRAAINVNPEDPFLLASFSDFLLRQDRTAEVLTLLNGRTQLDPLLLRLAIAEKSAGKPEFVEHRAELKNRFELQERRGDSIHLREQAMFLLKIEDNAAMACTIANQNFQKQRETVDIGLLTEIGRQTKCNSPTLSNWLSETKYFDSRLDFFEKGNDR